MPVFRSLFALVFCAIAAAVPAQTSLSLTTTPAGGGSPIACTYNASGAVAVDLSGSLQAPGSFGSNCGSITPPNPPVFVNPLAGDIPAAVSTGTALNLTWQADATSCSYTGSGFPSGVAFANWPTTGTACSSLAACNSLHAVGVTVPSTAPGTYTFNLTCSRTGSTVQVSSQAVTVASTNPTGCIAPAGLTRLTRATVCNVAGVNCRDDLDVTKFENVWGYRESTPNTLIPWPGLYNVQQRINLRPNHYVSLQFTVPSNYGTDRYGFYTYAETNFRAAMSMTVSTRCGDFNPVSAISPRCTVSNSNASSTLEWSTFTSGPNYDATCHLTRGQTYYLNILYAPLSAPTQSTCTPDMWLCDNSIQNGPGQF